MAKMATGFPLRLFSFCILMRLIQPKIRLKITGTVQIAIFQPPRFSLIFWSQLKRGERKKSQSTVSIITINRIHRLTIPKANDAIVKLLIRFFANKSFTLKTSRMYSVTFPMHIDSWLLKIKLDWFIISMNVIISYWTWQCQFVVLPFDNQSRNHIRIISKS